MHLLTQPPLFSNRAGSDGGSSHLTEFSKTSPHRFLTCADAVMRSNSSAVPRVVAAADRLLQGAVGHGQPAIEMFPSDNWVRVPPGPSSPWQHTQTLALQQAQNCWALQWGQLASEKRKLEVNHRQMWIRHQVILLDLLQQCPLEPAVLGYFAPQLPDTGTWQSHEAH